MNLSKTNVRNVLALLTLISVVLLLFILLFYPIPQRNMELVYMAMGYLMGQALGGVYGYFFGSSKAVEERHQADRKDNHGEQ